MMRTCERQRGEGTDKRGRGVNFTSQLPFVEVYACEARYRACAGEVVLVHEESTVYCEGVK